VIGHAPVPPFVTAAELAAWIDGARPAGLADAGLVVADVRWYLDGRDGRDAYRSGHLPGAVWVDVDHDLARIDGRATDGRHPLPSPEDFARSMGRLGIGDRSLVVAYDDSGGSTAGRLVLMLRWLGRPACLLDGGLGSWTGPMHRGDVTMPSRHFTPSPWPAGATATADEVASLAADPAALVIDARARERYTGAVALVDRRPGHVPGARHAPWADNLEPSSGRLRDVEDLAAHYRSLGVDGATDVVAYCGSGVSACLDVLAMEHAGLPTPRLYVASWSGWSADPHRPAARGDGQ
jgi:thiosulfate/3-mercaptopyruvate sulfurtransferase